MYFREDNEINMLEFDKSGRPLNKGVFLKHYSILIDTEKAVKQGFERLGNESPDRVYMIKLNGNVAIVLEYRGDQLQSVSYINVLVFKRTVGNIVNVPIFRIPETKSEKEFVKLKIPTNEFEKLWKKLSRDGYRNIVALCNEFMDNISLPGLRPICSESDSCSLFYREQVRDNYVLDRIEVIDFKACNNAKSITIKDTILQAVIAYCKVRNKNL